MREKLKRLFQCSHISVFHGRCRLYKFHRLKHCLWDAHSHARFKNNKDWQDYHEAAFGRMADPNES
jgi:hypothetical protein